MRKFLAAIAVCIIMIGTMSPITFSFSKNNSSNNDTGFSIQKTFAAIPAEGCPTGQTPNAAGTNCVNAGSNDDPDSVQVSSITEAFKCSRFDFACKISTLIVDLLTFVPNFIAVLMATLADVFLKISISPGTYGTPGSGIESGIREAWKIVRDFSNIGFIFALFVAAFMLIVDKTSIGGTQFDPKKVVVRVIIMALLVNFSMLFCRITIQTADLFSNFLYSKIGTYDYSKSGNATAQTVGNIFQSIGMKSVSLPIVSLSDPQALFQQAGIKSDATGTNAAYIILGVCIFIVLFVLIWTFSSMMFIFLGRILGLWLAIIISPLAFVSFAIPFLEKDDFIGFDSWLKNFLQLAFMTPVYLFFIYITVSVLNIEGIRDSIVTNSGIEIADATGGNWLVNVLQITLTTLIPLLLSCFFLLQGKKIATKMSGQIGEMVSGISGKVTGLAMGAAAGGTAFLARQTAGRAATNVANSDTLNNLKTKGYGIGTAATFAGLGASRLGATAFDVRDSKAFNTGFSRLGGAMGQKINLGDDKFRNTGGFEAEGGLRDIRRNVRNAYEEKQAKWEEAKAASMVPSKGSKAERDKREKEDKLDRAKRAEEAEKARIAMEAENQNVGAVIAQLELNKAGMTGQNPELDKDIQNRTKLKDDQKALEERDKELTRKINDMAYGESTGTLTAAEVTELAANRAEKIALQDELKKTKDDIKKISDKDEVKKFDKVDNEIKAFNKALAEEPNAAKRANMTVREVKQKQKNMEIVANGSMEKQIMDEMKEKMDKEIESFTKLDTTMKSLERDIARMVKENAKNPGRWSAEEIEDKRKEFASTHQKREEQYKKQKKAKNEFKDAEDVYKKEYGDTLKGLETAAKSAEGSYTKEQKGRVDKAREAVNLAQIDLNNTVDAITNTVYDNQKKLVNKLEKDIKNNIDNPSGVIGSTVGLLNKDWKDNINSISRRVGLTGTTRAESNLRSVSGVRRTMRR